VTNLEMQRLRYELAPESRAEATAGGEIVKRPKSSLAWSLFPLLALALLIALASQLQ
jgi:hypothetical protein